MNYQIGLVSRLLLAILCIVFCACRSNSTPSHTALVDTLPLPQPLPEPVSPVSMLDKSPLDIIYFPPDYPKLKMVGKASALPVFRIIYSRPLKHGRTIFGSVVKYGEHWRMGANEATEVEFFEPVKIQGTVVPAGRYVLYCLPQPHQWTLVLNTDLYSWGLVVDTTKDLYKFTVPVIQVNNTIEAFTMETEKAKDGALLWIGWDHSKVVLPVKPTAR